MEGYFFPDPDHDDPRFTRDFQRHLAKLKEQGVKVVYLEFLYEIVPTDPHRFEDDFVHCSGGRNAMAATYFAMAQAARQLGLEVIGLSRRGYYQMERQDPELGFAFRSLLPFDGLAAETIQRTQNSRPFVVFLGAAHWPLLSIFLPTLTEVGVILERAADPTDATRAALFARLAEAIGRADAYSGGDYTRRVAGLIREAHDRAMKTIAWDDPTDTLILLMHKFQDKFGLPPTLLQFNHLLALRLSPNIVWRARLVSNRN